MLRTAIVASACIAAALSIPRLAAQSIPADALSGLKARSIWPAVASGRVMTIAVDPSNKAVIGVYESEEGGRSRTNAGLKTSEHIGRIVISPKDGDTVYVAEQGPLWGGG